jgi:hypothetical protein
MNALDKSVEHLSKKYGVAAEKLLFLLDSEDKKSIIDRDRAMYMAWETAIKSLIRGLGDKEDF